MSELRTEYEKELKALQRQLDAAKAEHEAAQALMQKRIDDPSRDMAERDAELAKTRASHEQRDKERAERDDEISRLSTETRMLQTQLHERKECNKTMKSDMRHLQGPPPIAWDVFARNADICKNPQPPRLQCDGYPPSHVPISAR